MSSPSLDNGSRVYVGNLPLGVRHDDVKSLFARYGNLRRCDLREGIRGGYGFIDYGSVREAEDCVYTLNGVDCGGFRLKVEHYDSEHRRRPPRNNSANGFMENVGNRLKSRRIIGGAMSARNNFNGSHNNHNGSRRYSDEIKATKDNNVDRYFHQRYRPRQQERRTNMSRNVHLSERLSDSGSSIYRIIVTNVPYNASWQDLKDHMREAGNVTYADLNGDGTGVVEFGDHHAMQTALQLLDNSKLQSRQGDISYIRLRRDRSGSGLYDDRPTRTMNRQGLNRRNLARSRSPIERGDGVFNVSRVSMKNGGRSTRKNDYGFSSASTAPPRTHRNSPISTRRGRVNRNRLF